MVVYKKIAEHKDAENYGYTSMIYKRPNSSKEAMILNQNMNVNMSTFLNDKEILLEINNRYMLFSHQGTFI